MGSVRARVEHLERIERIESSAVRCCVAVSAVVLALVAFAPSASAASGTATASATSGAAGSTVTERSVTPCTLPSGVPGPAIVQVKLTRGTATLGSAQVTVASDGSWTATITVNASATSGAAQLTAFCLASAQAEGAVVDYAPIDFTVTGGSLARTGTPVRAELLAALLALAVGVALVHRRRLAVS